MLIICSLVIILVTFSSIIGVFFRGSGASRSVISERGEEYEMVVDGIYKFNSERMVAEGIGWDIFSLFIAVSRFDCDHAINL